MSTDHRQHRRAARLGIAAVVATGAMAAAPQPAPASDASPCGSAVSRSWSREPVQPCPLVAPEPGNRIPVYARPVERRPGAPLPAPDGWLNGTSGQYFVCQAPGPAVHHPAGWRNVWWAYTASDTGVAWGWVPQVYFKGGADDEPDAGLRRCPSAPGDGGGDGLRPQGSDRTPIPPRNTRSSPRPPRFELPFRCGQRWRLDTWGHSPALDMVREPQRETRHSEVRAAASGTVVTSRWHDASGNVVQIRHRNRWFTTYIHLERRTVKVGQKVRRGDRIGTVGMTGSEGHTPHLHFEVAWIGKGTPDWGHPGAPRVPVRFHGKTYTGQGRTWKHVVSRNCRDNEFIQRRRGGR
jgi:hypothetical protein